MTICSVVSSSAMVLTYKMSRTTSNTTKMCSKCTNFIKTIKATKQFVVFLFVHSWEQRKAKELFNSTADKGYPELPVLSATQDRGMIRRDENSINVFHDKKNELGYKRVLPGQFVIHLRSFQGGFAHSAIEGITSPAYTIFGFSEPEKHDSEYWKYVFTSKEFIRRLETVTYGIRDGRSISYDEFLTLDFVYPSKTEQTAIARYLDKLSDLITLHQCKCLDKLHALSILPCPLPSRKMTSFWEQRKLGELFSFRYGDGNTNPSNGGQYPVFGAGGIQGGYTEFNAENSIIIGHMGDAGCVSWGDGKHFVTYNGTITKPKNDIFSSKFGYYLLLSMDLRKYRGGSGLPFLTYEMLTEMWTQIPKEKDETRLIAECFTYLDNLITLHQRQLEKLKNIKSALLEKMFV